MFALMASPHASGVSGLKDEVPTVSHPQSARPPLLQHSDDGSVRSRRLIKSPPPSFPHLASKHVKRDFRV